MIRIRWKVTILVREMMVVEMHRWRMEGREGRKKR